MMMEDDQQRSLFLWTPTDLLGRGGSGGGVDPPPSTTTTTRTTSLDESHEQPVVQDGDASSTTTTTTATTPTVAKKKSWRSFISFPKGIVPSPSTAAAAVSATSHEEDQCRDSEKSPSHKYDDDEYDYDEYDDSTQTERVDPPPPPHSHHHHHHHSHNSDILQSSSPPSLDQERTQLRRLMASATDAWIQQQSSSSSAAATSSLPRTMQSDNVNYNPNPNQDHEVEFRMRQPHKTSTPQRQQRQQRRQQPPTTTTPVVVEGLSQVKSGGAARESKRSQKARDGREPEEIFSVEPEHGNHTLKPPLPDPEDPPSSNPDDKGSYSLETFMIDPRVRRHVTDKSKKEKKSKGFKKDQEINAQPSMTSTTKGVSQEKEKQKKKTTHMDFGQALPILAVRSTSHTSSSYTSSSNTTPTNHPLPPVESSSSSLNKNKNTHPRVVTWVSSVKPAAGQDHLKDLDQVFLRDDKYIWVPARVLEYRPEYAVCALDLPPLWTKMTIMMAPRNDHPEEEEETNMSSSSSSLLMKDLSMEDLQHFITTFHVTLTEIRVARYADYDAHELPLACCCGRGETSPPEGLLLTDVAHRHDPHLPGILSTLKTRFFHDKPYTRVGDSLLIAMNPFAWIPDLYESTTRDYYSNHFIWKGTCR